MASEFLLPDLGEGLTEAEIVSWLVAPGDVIAVDQLVVEVESAKSVVELPSPYGGRVAELHGAPGDVVHKGSPLITVVPVDIEGARAAPGSADAAPSGADAVQAAAAGADVVPGTAVRATAAEVTAAGSGAVLVGYGTKESTVRLRRPEGGRFGRRAGTRSAPPVAVGDASLDGGARSPVVSRPSAVDAVGDPGRALLDPTRRSPVVSPIVRKRARDHGFDASQLLGSGAGSLVLRDDVEAAIEALSSGTAAAASVVPASGLRGAAGATPDSPAGIGVADVRIPITGLRKVVAARLAQSRRLIPEATIWLDVDATELFAAKERLQKSTGERFSLTALIARFVVAGLKQYPILNSSVDDETNEIVQHGSINLGLAAQTPRGLMVPVVHGAHDLTTRTLRDEIAALVTRAEKGDFPPSALAGGTFTLNNYGGFGVDGSAAIINHPEVAMLGVGRVIDRPWVVDGEIVVRKVVELTLVFDHRVCDGDVASGFLTYVARCVEEPLLLLGNL
ncbi:dihydrolipoamide acetyltransferase family protein [Herbiconiux sp. UC225_62]|uniref:dihydrolipoamide acetyltransferase family protein n=1 Tax=Herbiconiux sp. UC225_62 TaxID=3350168 RepID=UPI0036D3A6C7